MEAWGFVLMMGLVSLFSDMTYEGARGVVGPFLLHLGAPAVAVGFAAGFGEFLGLGLRLGSGILADRTRGYWALVLLGYALTLASVPLLGLSPTWRVAVALMLADRVGKAIRAPSRDALLSSIADSRGAGKVFGIHEALDQVGAVAGPLLVAFLLGFGLSYRLTLLSLAVPAAAAMAFLLMAKRLYGGTARAEGSTPRGLFGLRGLRREFWLYLMASSLLGAGFFDFPLLAYMMGKAGLEARSISLLYALAMGVDALAALAMGLIFDRVGLKALFPAVIAGVLGPALAILGGDEFLVGLGVALWGVAMGGHESVLRASVGKMVPQGLRGSAYGVFNFLFGLSWFAGSVLLGLLYSFSPITSLSFSVACHLGALWLLWELARGGKIPQRDEP